MAIDNPQVVRVCNEVIRPSADRLAGLCTFADEFANRFILPEVLGPLGITYELLIAPTLPTEQDFPDDDIADGSVADGRPLMTRRKVLQLARVLLDLRNQKSATVYEVDQYVEKVAFALAVNPRV
jgi:hypothetical protein